VTHNGVSLDHISKEKLVRDVILIRLKTRKNMYRYMVKSHKKEMSIFLLNV